MTDDAQSDARTLSALRALVWQCERIDAFDDPDCPELRAILEEVQEALKGASAADEAPRNTETKGNIS